MFPLHRVVLPGESSHDRALYVRTTAGAATAPLHLAAGEALTTDTYFGLFPLAAWRRIASLASLGLSVIGTGRCRIGLRDLATGRLLGDTDTVLGGAFAVPLDPWLDGETPDALFVELLAAGPVRIDGIAFETADRPLRDLHLALVVTTFGRPAAIGATIERLAPFAADPPEPAFGRVSLTVIDNGRELDPDGAPRGATIVHNPNFGGAGGFARGLAHATDGGATHAIFMDDDAATEIECLLRTRRLLAFATDPSTAVAAAMLRSETSFMMHEQGAVFEWGRNHRIISRKNGLDLRGRDALLRVLQPEPVGYGGWWFFAFPITPDLRYPFPMFVRGDDWLFSSLNRFRIETLPGICSWQEGFENKIGPVEQYLATKAFLTAELMLREKRDIAATVRFFAGWVARNVCGYCYDRAAMNLAAIADVLEGPGFWERHVDLGPRLLRLRESIRAERLEPYTGGAAPARTSRPERLRKWALRIATLNGHLLPRALTDRLFAPRIDIPLLDAPHPRLAFGHTEVAYVTGDRAFLARRRNATALVQLARLAWLMGRLAIEWNSLARRYRNSVDRLCTRAWWDQARGSAPGPR